VVRGINLQGTAPIFAARYSHSPPNATLLPHRRKMFHVERAGRRRSEVGGRRSEVGGRRSGVGRRASGVGRRASGVGREDIFPRPSGATAAKRQVAIPHNPMTKNCKKPVKLLETGGLFYQADIAIHLCTQFKRAVIHGNVKTSQIVLVIVFPKRVV
jgi:hypothetical protein